MRTCWGVALALVGCGDVAGEVHDAPAVDAVTCVSSPASLRARWRGESNANEDTGVYNGITLGGLGYTAGKHGMAFVFDGIDDAVTADASDQLWPTGSFSAELWVEATALKPQTMFTPLFGKYDCGGADACGPALWSLYITDTGHPYFEIRVIGGNGASITASGSSVVDGAWHHLVGVRDVPARKLILYVDGKAAVETTLTDAFLDVMTSDGASDPVTIGTGRVSGTNTLSFEFSGALDDLAYYISALSPAEVAAIYAAPDGICR